ncbi:MAG: succinate dehydrogenase assembly factor 2 [Alphaproteobacteria bacterium]|nr:succinate dehydrogenase assembly factor 2 [Alphaproteobacteria bacterium]MDE2336296.1 succinate dehydrogenase assembly factor 2 [Alphaproteobacteria bacterium]
MPEETPEDNLSINRKRLIFRSWHRGTREMDLLLGRFAEAHVLRFGAAQAAGYERLLNNSDPDIYNWITGQEPVPPSEDGEVTALLLNFFKAT